MKNKPEVETRIEFMWVLTRELICEYGVQMEELPDLYEIQRLLVKVMNEDALSQHDCWIREVELNKAEVS